MSPVLAHVKTEFLLPVAIIPLLIFLPQLVIFLLQNDRFLDRLFVEHRDIWDDLGGPRGWQWSPPRGERAPYNSPTIYFDWFYALEPEWLLRAPDLREDYLSIRRNIRHWNFVAMPIIFGSWILFFLLIKLTEG